MDLVMVLIFKDAVSITYIFKQNWRKQIYYTWLCHRCRSGHKVDGVLNDLNIYISLGYICSIFPFRVERTKNGSSSRSVQSYDGRLEPVQHPDDWRQTLPNEDLQWNVQLEKDLANIRCTISRNALQLRRTFLL